MILNKTLMSDSKNNLIMSETKKEVPEKIANSQEFVNKDIAEAESSVETKISENNQSENVEQCVDDTPKEFNRANVEELGGLVHLVDSDEENKLALYCYVKCSESDSEILKQCRGVVFKEQELVMKAFPYTIEYNHTDTKSINDMFRNFSEWSFFESHEGALVRMFYFDSKWYVSTHRKLNAFRSKWASKDSFGTSFKNALLKEEELNEKFRNSLPSGDNILDRFQSTLDKNKQYMFLVRNNKDNRIVCSPPDRATVYHVGTFIDGELSVNDKINIPSPKEYKFSDIQEMLDYVDQISYKDTQGIISFNNGNKKVVKVFHQSYQDLFKARGNEPSIKFRYLQVRMQKRTMNMLYHLYPDKIEVFDEYENTLFDIARSIYRSYVQRFIKKRYVTVPKEEFSVIRECHSWHLSDRQNNRISIDTVINFMNKQSPTSLNHMIRRYKLEKDKQQQEESNRPREDSIRSTKSYEKSPAVRVNQTVPISPLLLSVNTKPITTTAVKQKR